ncbi:MAG: endolytic transglycosylase MltG [Ignavibacteriaceae bacterium]|nr:endolytic transglycosylase MltG [Ignavibacteriaceae bacterium]
MNGRNSFEDMSPEEREKILNALRSEVDGIDQELVELLRKRTIRSILIGRIKRSLNQPTYSPEREKDINKKISKYLKEPLRPDALWRIYERILDQSRAVQREEAEKGEIYNVPVPKLTDEKKKLLPKNDWKVIGIVFAVVFLLLTYIFYGSNTPSKGLPVRIEIKPGLSADQVVKMLDEAGLLPTPSLMKLSLLISGNSTSIVSARYTITEPMSYMGLSSYLAAGRGNHITRVDLYDGISNNGIASVMDAEKVINKDSLLSAMNNAAKAKQKTGKFESLRGFLLPGSYYFYRNSSAQEIIDSLFNGWQNIITADMKESAEKMGRSEHELTILASIIEGETNYKPEMKRISGVYHNRLRIRMPLQADPTIQFIAPPGTQRITSRELRIKSPYNTYLNAGLPPGPINNPGKAALDAAFFPEKHTYLYFVVDPESGRHVFTRTYSEHLKEARKYHQWIKAKQK